MLEKLASTVFLIDALAIGLGAFGHGLAVRQVHAAIDQFPIEADIHSMVYVVWYFVSGACSFSEADLAESASARCGPL